MLSVALPGAAQLALGHTKKGVVTIAVSALLFVDILVHTFIIAAPLFGAILDGRQPVIDERTLEPLKTLLVIFSIALAIWVWALFDTIMVARRAGSGKENR